MEETTSWKNHSFTLLIFGGIVVLCSIFFVLGMLVGRNQGIKMAGTLAEQETDKPVAIALTDDSALNYYDETKEDKPDFPLEPAPAPPPTPRVPLTPANIDSGTSTTAGAKAADNKPRAPKPTEVKDDGPKTGAPARSAPQVYLQIMSTKDKKAADAQRKKVESQGFSSKVFAITLKNERWHRVVVGPYKEAEVNGATSNLKAKGYTPMRAQQ